MTRTDIREALAQYQEAKRLYDEDMERNPGFGELGEIEEAANIAALDFASAAEAWLVQNLDDEPTLNEMLDHREARRQWQTAAVLAVLFVLGIGAAFGFWLGYEAYSAEQVASLPALCVMAEP